MNKTINENNFIEAFEIILKKNENNQDFSSIFFTEECYNPSRTIKDYNFIDHPSKGWTKAIQDESLKNQQISFNGINSPDSGEYLYKAIMLGKIATARKMFIKGYSFRETEESLIGISRLPENNSKIMSQLDGMTFENVNPQNIFRDTYSILNFFESGYSSDFDYENASILDPDPPENKIDRDFIIDITLMEKHFAGNIMDKLCSDKFGDGVAVGAHTYYGYAYKAVMDLILFSAKQEHNPKTDSARPQ